MNEWINGYNAGLLANARHNAQMARLGEVLRRIAEDPRGQEEPGSENKGFPAWEFGQWARMAMTEHDEWIAHLDRINHTANEKGQRPGDKNAMKNTETQSPGSLHRMVRRLFDARQAAAAAKKARAEKAAEVGDCEYFDADARGEEMGVKCYNTKRKEWCAVCLAKQPFYDDYQRKAALAGAALQAVLRAGKRMTPNDKGER